MSGKQRTEQNAPRWKRQRIPGYTPEVETAEELGVAIRTLRKWRQLRIGPPWTEVGRQIHYNDESRAEWLKACEVQPTRDHRWQSQSRKRGVTRTNEEATA